MVIVFVQSKQTSLEDETKLEPAAHPVEVNPTLIPVAAVAKLTFTVKIVDPLYTFTLDNNLQAPLNK